MRISDWSSDVCSSDLSRLATEFDTTRSCLDTPCGGALGDALPLPTGCDPQHRDYYLCKLGSRINHRLGQRSEASPGLLHCMEDIQQIAGVAGKAICRRHHQHVAII